MTDTDFILTLSCPNRTGIVYAVSKFLFEHGCNITDSAQFDDPSTNLFFNRVAFSSTRGQIPLALLTEQFAQAAAEFGMDWNLVDRAIRPRVIIMVSKFDHCLADLLYRYSTGELGMDIPMVISNHRDTYRLAAAYDIPFHHLPVNKGSKAQQETKLLEMLREEGADLLVLARYMQILSDDLCAALPCPAINIHHSFLPSFKGALPYHQAHKRGVKIIGATAHYVTPDLDEGPIIEQDVARITHHDSPEDMVVVGRDVERLVLSRAVRQHIERRILMNGAKTVVFK